MYNDRSPGYPEKEYPGGKKNLTGQCCCAYGHDVSAAGRDEEAIGKNVKKRQKEDRRDHQLSLLRQIAATFEVAHVFQPLRAVHIFQATGSAGGL